MSAKETWIAHGCTVYTDCDWKDGVNRGGKWVGKFFQCDDEMPTNEQLSRATLAAAAPDLLTALESCLDSMERNGPPPIQQGTLCEEQDWTTALIKARAAILKAKGGQ